MKIKYSNPSYRIAKTKKVSHQPKFLSLIPEKSNTLGLPKDWRDRIIREV